MTLVFSSGLLPMVSFDVASYGAGLARKSLSRFSIATFQVMLSVSFVYNCCCSVLTLHNGWTLGPGLLTVLLFAGLPVLLGK